MCLSVHRPTSTLVGFSSGFCLLLLNQPVAKSDLLRNIWNKAKVRVAVDGGLQHWNNIRKQSDLLPDLITGDFDSVSKSVLTEFEVEHKVKVVETPDQNFTDFTKAIKQVKAEGKIEEIQSIFAFVETGGRLDQILANIETLFQAKDILNKNQQLFLLSSQEITWLLNKGTHTIIKDKEGDGYVGLIPIGAPVSKVKTSGLEWNLNDDELSFGKLVSTSNRFAKGQTEVTVETSGPILWTMSHGLSEEDLLNKL